MQLVQTFSTHPTYLVWEAETIKKLQRKQKFSDFLRENVCDCLIPGNNYFSLKIPKSGICVGQVKIFVQHTFFNSQNSCEIRTKKHVILNATSKKKGRG